MNLSHHLTRLPKRIGICEKNLMVFTPNISPHLSQSSMPNLPTHSVGGLLVVFQLSVHNICCPSYLNPLIDLPREGNNYNSFNTGL